MLFNTYQFLFLFLPAVIAAHRLALRLGGSRAAVAALVAASLVFYAAWDWRFVSLLFGSILVNHLAAAGIARALRHRRERLADVLLAAAIATDLVLLGAFKYAPFVTENLNRALGSHLVALTLLLPLGISFFTFEQISYLVDLRRGGERADLLRFAFFVSFFPRLVAGPILRWSEIGPQIGRSFGRVSKGAAWDDLAVGLTILAIGLFKKTAIADGLAPYASRAFSAAAAGDRLDLLAAWGGTLAYTLQLYYDFSGYSDMAIGAARCFGVRLPLNFASPYKATDIIEFWRRWHMTLSRFLRDYLYIPFGGSRRGAARRYANLMATMLIGGLWHGAGWTFVFWGGLHGVYLALNHAARAIRRRDGPPSRPLHPAAVAWRWALTFGCVVVAWVFFRSASFGAALAMLKGMGGFHGISLPLSFASLFAGREAMLFRLGVTFDGGGGVMLVKTWAWIAVVLPLTLIMPNTQQIMAHWRPALDAASPVRFAWNPSLAWAVAIGFVACAGMFSVSRVSEFLYWQF